MYARSGHTAPPGRRSRIARLPGSWKVSGRSTNIFASILPACPSYLESLFPEKFNICGADLEASRFVRLTSVSQVWAGSLFCCSCKAKSIDGQQNPLHIACWSYKAGSCRGHALHRATDASQLHMDFQRTILSSILFAPPGFWMKLHIDPLAWLSLTWKLQGDEKLLLR